MEMFCTTKTASRCPAACACRRRARWRWTPSCCWTRPPCTWTRRNFTQMPWMSLPSEYFYSAARNLHNRRGLPLAKIFLFIFSTSFYPRLRPRGYRLSRQKKYPLLLLIPPRICVQSFIMIGYVVFA